MAYHHPSRSCGPCHICGKHQHHFEALDVEKKQFLQRYISNIPDDSCICRAHKLEAKRHLDDLEYVPTWKKITTCTRTSNSLKCTYPKCTETSLTGRVIVPSPERRGLFCEARKM